MNREEIEGIISSLSISQGFYGRLHEYILENPEYLDYLESLGFHDAIDLILYLEI